MVNLPEMVALRMINYFKKDLRRINHSLKVYGFAKTIAGLEKLPPDQYTVLEIAALLHDIGIREAEKQYQSSAGPYQESLGPGIARDLLKGLNIPENIVNRICYLIGHHHTYGKIDSLDFQILVEADFLVNIFEDQMNQNQIAGVKQQYFKTTAGTALIQNLYL